jgi:hypothetical protein
VHPTRTGHDQSVILTPLPGGTYGTSIGPLEQVAWRVLLEDEISGWRIVGTLPPGQNRADLGPRQEK